MDFGGNYRVFEMCGRDYFLCFGLFLSALILGFVGNTEIHSFLSFVFLEFLNSVHCIVGSMNF